MGGSYYYRGLKWEQGAEPLRAPLTLTTGRSGRLGALVAGATPRPQSPNSEYTECVAE